MGRKPSKLDIVKWFERRYKLRINGYSLQREVLMDDLWLVLDKDVRNRIKVEARLAGFSRQALIDLEMYIDSSLVPTYYELDRWFDALEYVGSEATVAGDGTLHAPAISSYFSYLKLKDSSPAETAQLHDLFIRWCVAAVNGALRRKHNDVMLLIVGGQGKYKTSYLAHLTPPELRRKYYYQGHIVPSLTNRETVNLLAERWILNIDDMLDNILKKEMNAIKGIISASAVTKRVLYSDSSRTRPRIASFCGTLNDDEFLYDDENRRYFVIEVEDIDPAYIDFDTTTLWADAYRLAGMLDPYRVYDRSAYDMIRRQNRRFETQTTEESLLSLHFVPSPDPEHRTVIYMTTGDIVTYLSERTRTRISPLYLGKALRRMGFAKENKYLSRFAQSRKVWILYAKDADGALGDYEHDYLDHDEFVKTNDKEEQKLPF